MYDRDTIQQHRRALTAGALYFLSATDGPIPADPLIAAVAADLDALLARVAALERVLVDVDSVLQRAQDACDRAEQPARAQDCYIARQQIAALFPSPD